MSYLLVTILESHGIITGTSERIVNIGNSFPRVKAGEASTTGSLITTHIN